MNRILFILLLPLMLGSCESWLNVQPYDRVAEGVAFSSVKGFENALNGIYIEMNQNALYGRSMSCEMIEIMAQRYSINSQSTYNLDLMQHKYGEESTQLRFSSVWELAYKLIANTNFLLKNCEEYREVLSDEYYAIIKGEAYALRALLHFDIFRLFGPIYDPSRTNELPYYKEFTMDRVPHIKPVEFMEYVIDDLHLAADLLKEDVAITDGVRNVNSNSFYSDRNYRLNWYAVQLLLARAELYRGNKTEALVAAKNVIDAQEKWFPWVKREAISSALADVDRTFYPEIVFGLQNSTVENLYTTYFDGATLNLESLLAPLSGQVDVVFENNMDDYRYIAYMTNRQVVGGATYTFFEKYKHTDDSLAGQVIPMLRVTEAFYIAAEAEVEPADGLKWLNQVLAHRGVKEVTDPQKLAATLEMEYMREFWGEGQLFFYYKRLKYPAIRSAADKNYVNTIVMSDEQYQIPIPKEESKYD